MDSHSDDLTAEIVSHPGVEYKTFIQTVIATFGAQSYFEIGTQHGESLAMMPCDAIAVDPSFRVERNVMAGKRFCGLFQMPSDAFFAGYSPAALFGRPIDVAFLDGMHRHEYLLRDFLNTERNCRNNSVIFLHDCLPPTLEMTSRIEKGSSISDKYRGYWTGDVWKVIPILRKYRKDLKIHFIDCPPTGLVMITNLDPASSFLESGYFDALAEVDATGGSDYETLRAAIAAAPLLSGRELIASERLSTLIWL